jgi:hypothetical protein
MKRFLYNLLPLTLIIITSCKMNYSFTGASISPEIKTVSIQFFSNQAPLAQPILSQSFTESLRDVFISQTSLTLSAREGDLQIGGAITGYNTSIIGVSGGNNSQATKNRLTITVNVKFINTKDEKQNYETSFSRFADYDANQNFAAVENDLMQQINLQLVQDIFNKSVANW